MRYLIDTGVLLRWFECTDANYAECREVLTRLRSRTHTILVTHQNLAEFWGVSTRPTTARGGYGQDPNRVIQRLDYIQRNCETLIFDHQVYQVWRGLLILHSVRGTAVHDSRLAAHAMHYEVDHLISLNKSDFRRYGQVSVLLPSEFLTS